MRTLRKTACAAMAALFLAGGCATHSYTPGSDAATRDIRIKAGDHIRVVTTRRERVSFTITEVRAGSLSGVTLQPGPKERRPPDEPLEVAFDEIAVLQVTRFSPGMAAVFAVVTVSMFAAVTAVAVPVLVPPAAGAP